MTRRRHDDLRVQHRNLPSVVARDAAGFALLETAELVGQGRDLLAARGEAPERER